MVIAARTSKNNLNNLSQRSLIGISGPDAEKFLQGQLTCDVREVKAQNVSLGAYCNVKGRVVATFRIYYFQDSFYLLLPQAMMEKTISLLQKYGIFSKVKIEEVTEKKLCEKLNTEFNITAENNWQLADIQAGIPTIYPATSEMFTPQMLNLSELNAVSFNKGCYLGQEIVARTEYLGKAKRHLVKLTLKKDKDILPGQEIDGEKNNVGVVINAIKINNDWLILAVI